MDMLWSGVRKLAINSFYQKLVTTIITKANVGSSTSSAYVLVVLVVPTY